VASVKPLVQNVLHLVGPLEARELQRDADGLATSQHLTLDCSLNGAIKPKMVNPNTMFGPYALQQAVLWPQLNPHVRNVLHLVGHVTTSSRR
jgi:hypothetical protein